MFIIILQVIYVYYNITSYICLLLYYKLYMFIIIYINVVCVCFIFQALPEEVRIQSTLAVSVAVEEVLVSVTSVLFNYSNIFPMKPRLLIRAKSNSNKLYIKTSIFIFASVVDDYKY